MATYKIIGADGKEYGPANLEHVSRWVAEGRVNAQTRLQAIETGEWKSAGEFGELSQLFVPRTPPPTTASLPSVAPSGITPPITRPQKGLAVTSFVLALVSFVLCFGVLTGIPAIICGHMARNRARRSPTQYGAPGLATAGLILGYLSLAYTFVILGMVMPIVGKARTNRARIQCTSNLRQIALAFRIWSVDHNGEFPFNVSTNAGGTKEFCAPGPEGFDRNAPAHFASLSRELGTPRPLVCPADSSKFAAPDFEQLKAGNVTYRLRTGPEITETNTTEVLAECPIHGTVLRCDGSIEPQKPKRKYRRL